MILDEPMEMALASPIEVSCKGDVVKADTLRFMHPGPQMARATAKMHKYFSKITKATALFVAKLNGPDKMQEQAQAQLTAGSKIQSLHQELSDTAKDAEKVRTARLKKIDGMVEEFSGMLDLCDDIDLYQFAVDFGKMIVDNKRCYVICGEDSVLLTMSLWEDKIFLKDRVAAAIRYCCFFEITSSVQS